MKIMHKKKNYDKKIADYPCVDYLRNALFFIREEKYYVAYEEICQALHKAGVELKEEELEYLKMKK